MSLLGLEIGRTRCRVLAVSEDGVVLGHARRDYAPANDAGRPRTLDARQVWAAVRDALGEAIAGTQHDPVRALSIASTGEVLVPLSSDGQILASGILCENGQAASYLRRLREMLGEERFFDITGQTLHQARLLAQLCRLYEQERRLYEQTWRFVPLGSLVAHLLGGSLLCDHSLAARLSLFAIGRQEWSGRVLATCGLPPLKLPELAPAGTPLGTISAAVARLLGLPATTRLVLGGHDLACSALGSGVTQPGQALYSMGAAFWLVPVFQAVPLRSLMLHHGLSMAPHVVAETFLSWVQSASGGAVLQWFRDTLAPLEKREAQKRGSNVYAELLAEMPEEPTSLIAIPNLASGAIPATKSPATIVGLELGTDRGTLIKALLEGIALFFAQGRHLFEQVGIRLASCRATGGGARSEPWLQLTADVLDLPLESTEILAPAPLGAAILAGVGGEVYEGNDQAIAALVRVRRRYEPDPQRAARYRDKLERYRALCALLEGYAHR